MQGKPAKPEIATTSEQAWWVWSQGSTPFAPASFLTPTPVLFPSHILSPPCLCTCPPFPSACHSFLLWSTPQMSPPLGDVATQADTASPYWGRYPLPFVSILTPWGRAFCLGLHAHRAAGTLCSHCRVLRGSVFQTPLESNSSSSVFPEWQQGSRIKHRVLLVAVRGVSASWHLSDQGSGQPQGALGVP
jgi:hypothetical protein